MANWRNQAYFFEKNGLLAWAVRDNFSSRAQTSKFL
jgi:hypothetical protein